MQPDGVLSVGERGHIISWKNDVRSQQHQVPVSVTLTDVALLSDGTKVAIGHDSVILVSPLESLQWHKVFSGYELITQKMAVLQHIDQ